MIARASFWSICDDKESITVQFFVTKVLITRITVDSDTQSKVNDVIIACLR